MRFYIIILSLSCLCAGSLSAVDAPLGHAEFKPTPTHPVGWRGDGSGVFPGARPITDYDPAGKNLLWRQGISAWGNASPIVVGGLVVVTAEPDLVLAFDALTGKPAWQADSAWTEGLPAARAEELRRTIAAALLGMDQAAADAAQQALKPMRMVMPGDHHALGFTLPTPASDGQRIYVKCGTGTLCAYDLAGKRLWRHANPRMNANPTAGSSPLVIGGRVVVLVKGEAKDTVTVSAIDAATGTVAWEVRDVTDAGYRAVSSPIAMQIDGTPLILVPGGDLLRASDGKRLAEKLPSCHLGGSPIAIGNVIVATYGTPDKKGWVAAHRLTLEGERIQATQVFATERKGYNIASPVKVGDALLVFNYDHLALYDAVGGAALPFDTKLKIRGDGHAFWPSPAVAGEAVVLPLNDGQIHVFAASREWKPIATAKLDPLSSCPFFLGTRTYFRTSTGLLCFGRP